MGMEVPEWLFFCGFCCDGDNIDVITAYGIWLGYLRRMLATHFLTSSEKCNPEACLLTSSRIIGSEWVQRYLRLVLTEPGATIAVTVEQRNAAVLALAALLLGALPQSYMNAVPSDKRAGAVALR